MKGGLLLRSLEGHVVVALDRGLVGITALRGLTRSVFGFPS